MNPETTEKSRLGSLNYLLHNHLNIFKTEAIPEKGCQGAARTALLSSINEEAASKLQDSAEEIDKSVSALLLPLQKARRGDEASLLNHCVLRAVWPFDGPWKACRFGPDYAASVEHAIEEVEKLAQLVGDSTVADSRGERSEVMSLSEMSKRLGFPKYSRRFRRLVERCGLRNEGKRESWTFIPARLLKCYRETWLENEGIPI